MEIYLLLTAVALCFTALIYVITRYIALLSVSAQKDKSEALIMLLNNMTFLTANRIKKMISKGADVNFAYYVLEEKHTPLVKAILNNCSVKVIEELIKNGADTELLTTNKTNMLMLAAAFYKNPRIIPVLTAAGLDINHANESGATALIYAAKFSSNHKIIKELIDNGADTDIEDALCRKAASYLEDNSKLAKSKICKVYLDKI